MLLNCSHCNLSFKRKPSEIGRVNYCSKNCSYSAKTSSPVEKTFKKFIKNTWTNINIRCGKYQHLQTIEKCKSYKDIKILFNREEFKNWCWNQRALIQSLRRPSIDRIDPNKHYSLDNIQIIELIKNIQKKRPGNNFLNGPKSKTVRGVRKNKNKFIARITALGKEKYIGSFNSYEEALIAFKNAYFNIYGNYPY